MKKRDAIYVLVFLLLLLTWLIYFCANYVHVKVDGPLPKIDSVTYVDTIPYYKPIPKDSAVVRYVTIKVPTPTKKDSTPHIDSVEVELPITQKEYQDSGYHAWVSGYLPKLDSIKVYNKNTIITQTVTTTKYKTKRWGVGVQVGYGYNFNKVAPYIGIGVQYNILSW